MAEKAALNVAALAGSGPGGRVVARDVAAAASAPAAAAPSGPLNVAVAPPADGKGIQPDADVPVGGMRQTIARRLLESKITVPHFYLEVEVDAAPLMAMRESLNKRLAEAGADAIKADVWVARVLEEHGATFKKATDVIEVTRYAEAVAEAMGVSRLVLDQMLWRGEWKITQHALDELEKTAAWKKFARGYGKVRGRPVRPADIYGPKGMLDGWGISFKTPGDLWEVLARNMGGGMPPEVPKALVNLCGPRVESLARKSS